MDLSARIMAHALTELVVENSVPELSAAARDLTLARETQALSIIRDIVEDDSIADSSRICAIYKVLSDLDVVRTSGPKFHRRETDFFDRLSEAELPPDESPSAELY